MILVTCCIAVPCYIWRVLRANDLHDPFVQVMTSSSHLIIISPHHLIIISPHHLIISPYLTSPPDLYYPFVQKNFGWFYHRYRTEQWWCVPRRADAVALARWRHYAITLMLCRTAALTPPHRRAARYEFVVLGQKTSIIFVATFFGKVPAPRGRRPRRVWRWGGAGR